MRLVQLFERITIFNSKTYFAAVVLCLFDWFAATAAIRTEVFVYAHKHVVSYDRNTLTERSIVSSDKIIAVEHVGRQQVQTQFRLTDHLDSTVATVDIIGYPQAGRLRWPYGEVLADGQARALDSQPGYTGQRRDLTSQWMDFHARQYDPLVARFCAVDPLAHQFESSAAYVYGHNRPLRFVDPNGKAALPFESAAVADRTDVPLQLDVPVLDIATPSLTFAQGEIGDRIGRTEAERAALAMDYYGVQPQQSRRRRRARDPVSNAQYIHTLMRGVPSESVRVPRMISIASSPIEPRPFQVSGVSGHGMVNVEIGYHAVYLHRYTQFYLLLGDVHYRSGDRMTARTTVAMLEGLRQSLVREFEDRRIATRNVEIVPRRIAVYPTSQGGYPIIDVSGRLHRPRVNLRHVPRAVR